MFSLRLTLMLCAACGAVSEHSVRDIARRTAASPESIPNESSTRFYERDQSPTFPGVVTAFAEYENSVLAQVVFTPPECCTEHDIACATRDSDDVYLLRREVIDGWVWGVGNTYRVLIARCVAMACDTHQYIGIHSLDSNTRAATHLGRLLHARITSEMILYPPYACSEAERAALSGQSIGADMQQEMERMQQDAQQQDVEDTVAEHE